MEHSKELVSETYKGVKFRVIKHPTRSYKWTGAYTLYIETSPVKDYFGVGLTKEMVIKDAKNRIDQFIHFDEAKFNTFFKERFPHESIDGTYADEWRGRFKRGTPEMVGDKETKQVMKKYYSGIYYPEG